MTTQPPFLESPPPPHPPLSAVLHCVTAALSALERLRGRRVREVPVAGRLCSMTAPVKLIDDKGERLFLAGWGFNPAAVLIHLSWLGEPRRSWWKGLPSHRKGVKKEITPLHVGPNEVARCYNVIWMHAQAHSVVVCAEA